MSPGDRSGPGPHPQEHEPVIIRDKRKVDRETGQVRADAARGSEAPVSGASGAGATAGAVAQPGGAEAEDSFSDVFGPDTLEKVDKNAMLLAERTEDLQRVHAEYANYRKRADRDRLAAGDLAVSKTLIEFLPVVDNLERARAHDDLSGGLKALADQLDAIFTKLGLVAFGAVGDPFDPTVHEAVMHTESDEVSHATCTTIMRPGYKHGDRLLRPAMVGVSEPATPPAATPEADAPADAATATDEDAGTPALPREDASAAEQGPTQP